MLPAAVRGAVPKCYERLQDVFHVSAKARESAGSFAIRLHHRPSTPDAVACVKRQIQQRLVAQLSYLGRDFGADNNAYASYGRPPPKARQTTRGPYKRRFTTRRDRTKELTDVHSTLLLPSTCGSLTNPVLGHDAMHAVQRLGPDHKTVAMKTNRS